MLYMYTCFRYWYVNIVKYDFRYPCSQRYCYIYIVYIYIVAYTCTKDPVHRITVSDLPNSFLSIYSHIYWHSYIYIYIICNYILKFSPSIRYHATLYTHCVYIYIPSDLPNRHSPKQYVPHLLVKHYFTPLLPISLGEIEWISPETCHFCCATVEETYWNQLPIFRLVETLLKPYKYIKYHGKSMKNGIN